MSKKRKAQDIPEYQKIEFFKDSIKNPEDSKYYGKKYIYINIAIDQLDVYKNLRNKYNDKIEIDKNSNISQKYTDDQICQYVFIRLFRSLFYFDYAHDFGNVDRDGNSLYKGLTKEEKKKQKKKIIEIYDNIYKHDILDIYRFVFKNDESQFSNVKNFDKNIKLKDSKIQLNLLNVNTKQDIDSENDIKNKVLNIIIYLGIKPVDIIDNIKNCGETFDDIIQNINDYSTDEKNIELFVDADKSRFSLYPILNKICSLLFTNLSNIKKINYNKSILDKYDGASTSSLRKIIKDLKEYIYPNNINIDKINNIDLSFSSIKIIFKLNEDDSYDNRFIELNFKQDKDDSIGLNINRFFTLGADDEKNLSDSSVAAVSLPMNNTLDKIKSNTPNKIKEEVYANFILQSYYKTMGDFSQIILVHQLSKINKKNIYLFLTFDKIASYISSLFNIGTLKEENNNPLLPLKYFQRDFKISKTTSASVFNYLYVNNYLSDYLKKRVKTTNFGKIKPDIKMTRIIKLADKYNVSYKKLTYKQLYDKLYKLYKLQILAKKLRIPITYKSSNKRKYKSILNLEKDIKKYK